eukprot:CAMPEP_0172780812 /NCGR_PEP_ID=MMETSP1074-20121228/203117_1 /TAXON_ID=2916 /ORGANISM="Ceratium fusus, Strain PA161109" /LENGTH=254 /DNA_ID=CAMNT_0013617789 /DNA_START=80 /DNA_END=845 /DNA_ORIENTATION=+
MSCTVVKHVTASACFVVVLVTAINEPGKLGSAPCGYGTQDACLEDADPQVHIEDAVPRVRKKLLQVKGRLDTTKVEENVGTKATEIELQQVAASSQLPLMSKSAVVWKPATANVQGICSTTGAEETAAMKGRLDTTKVEENVGTKATEIELQQVAASSQLPLMSKSAVVWKPATANVQGICDLVKEEAERKLRKIQRLVSLPKFEALGYSVAHGKGGTKYRVKVDIGEGLLALLRVVGHGNGFILAGAELFRTQ